MLWIWTHIMKALEDIPPEVQEAKQQATDARIALLQESLKQQRRAYEVRQELARVMLSTVVKGHDERP